MKSTIRKNIQNIEILLYLHIIWFENSTSFENWLLHCSYYIPLVYLSMDLFKNIIIKLNTIYENVEALIGPINDIE